MNEKRKKEYSYTYLIDKDGVAISANEIANSYCNGFNENVEDNGRGGLRIPQFGALSSIRANWTIGNDALTIVLPTGTGKSETMLAAILAGKIKRSLVIVPNQLLRNQTYDRARTWGILREIGCVNGDVLNPNTLCLKSGFKDFESFSTIVESSNIIVSTMSLVNKMSKEQIACLSAKCDLLVVDEAHHISSTTWRELKKEFLSKKILQFTATPYRQDGKLVDGKIAYNFPMHMAIEQKYFKPIEFIAVEEYNENLVDRCIANQAITNLEKDVRSGLNHVLLVRANTIERAEYLYENIYSEYSQFNPVIITSKVKTSEKKQRLSQIKNCESRIVICVDMFGEGIDIPNLKIAALHDKYKSLPITLQFIGRFARCKEDLGVAKVVANIADINVMDSLKELYEKDADWNTLLPIKSEKNIQEKLSLQELIAGFDNMSSDVDLKQIKAKVSMKAYTCSDNVSWNPDRWDNVLDESNCRTYINHQEKIIVLIEPFSSYQEWTTQRNIKSLNWNFYIIYWNENKKYVCINASNHQKGNELLKNIFGDYLFPVRSESVFRCLADIKRLVFASVGLNSAIDGPIRYKMFAGIDVAQGISESSKNNCYKSNVFGMGYEGDGRISIGCSYKGKIWSRWVENISFWKNWCDNVMGKILDSNNDSKILENVLVPKVISEVPKDMIAYRIDFEERILIDTNNIYISSLFNTYDIHDCELRIGGCIDNKQYFRLVCPNEVFSFYLFIEKEKYSFYFEDKDKSEPKISKRNREPVRLTKYFNENPPVIWYVGTSSLQGNVLLKASVRKDSFFPNCDFIKWDWNSMNVNIQIESQLDNDGSKKVNSIQYATINKLKKRETYSVIFDDDGSGEIADIVAIAEEDDEITVELYHCKYSNDKIPGARINDLYEVCGQTEKSVFWKSDGVELINRMKSREAKRLKNSSVSRFELGNIDILNMIQKKMLHKQIKMKIFMVQPGVDSSRISPEMRVVLGGTRDFCRDTFSVSVKLICS